jgi:hypothetical protein
MKGGTQSVPRHLQGTMLGAQIESELKKQKSIQVLSPPSAPSRALLCSGGLHLLMLFSLALSLPSAECCLLRSFIKLSLSSSSSSSSSAYRRPSVQARATKALRSKQKALKKAERKEARRLGLKVPGSQNTSQACLIS